MGAAGSRTSGSGAGVVPQVGRGFRGGGILPRRDGGWLGRRPHRKLGTLERKKYEVRSKKCGGRPEAAFFHGPPEGRTALLPFTSSFLLPSFFALGGKKTARLPAREARPRRRMASTSSSPLSSAQQPARFRKPRSRSWAVCSARASSSSRMTSGSLRASDRRCSVARMPRESSSGGIMGRGRGSAGELAESVAGELFVDFAVAGDGLRPAGAVTSEQ